MKKYLIILLLILTTGCNYQDLNELAIITGINISYNHNQYEVIVEIANPKSNQDNSRNEEPEFIIYKNQAPSLQEAIKKITLQCPKKLYTSHINLLIIDETIAKNHLSEVLNFFIRNSKIRNEFYVLVGKNKNILTITTPLENISSKSILNSLKLTKENLGYTNLITFHNLLDTYLNPYKELAISSIEIKGNEEETQNTDNQKNTERKTYHQITGIGIFKNNKLIDYLNEEDTLIYNIITKNTNHFIINSNITTNQYITSELKKKKTNIIIDEKKKNIKINIKAIATITENTTNEASNSNKIEKYLNNIMKEKIYTSLTSTIKKYHTDIYGFQNILYQKNPQYIKSLKANWNDEILEQFQIIINTNIKLSKKGLYRGGIYHE